MTSNNNKKLIEMPKIDSDVWSVWNDATAFRKTRVLCQTFGLNDDESLIVVKTPGKVLIDEDNCWSNMIKLFPEQEIRWALLNVPYRVLGGGVRERVAFVRWCPDSLQRENHKKTIQAKCNAVMFCGELAQRATKLGATLIEANSVDELQLDSVIAKLTKHEREPLDPTSLEPLRRTTTTATTATTATAATPTQTQNMTE